MPHIMTMTGLGPSSVLCKRGARVSRMSCVVIVMAVNCDRLKEVET